MKQTEITAFFEQVFEIFTISRCLGWSHGFENFERMSSWVPISNGFVISSLLASGDGKNLFFVSIDRS